MCLYCTFSRLGRRDHVLIVVVRVLKLNRTLIDWCGLRLIGRITQGERKGNFHLDPRPKYSAAILGARPGRRGGKRDTPTLPVN